MNTFLVWFQFILSLIDHFDEFRLVFRIQDGVERLDVLARFCTPAPQLSFRPDLFFLGGRGLGRRVTVTPRLLFSGVEDSSSCEGPRLPKKEPMSLDFLFSGGLLNLRCIKTHDFFGSGDSIK